MAVLPAASKLKLCTCDWSPVNTATIDPPHIIRRDPDCPAHREYPETHEEWEMRSSHDA